ncbi:MAG TPA: hypothetical protein VFV92_11670, partial [Candidatus Bathyarchaeia archaeon]|nr:hypothetical protein [Candidatus Bathyarchaeia archaeon]
MTAIAGIIVPAKMGTIDPILRKLAEAMSSRGSITGSLIIREKAATLGIVSCSHQVEGPSYNSVQRTSLVADGQVSADLQVEEIGGEIDAGTASETLRTGRPFAFLAISGGRLLAGRDPLGQKPLYAGKNRDGTIAIASLRAALE